MIIITGATGELGSRIVDRLLERVPPETVGVSVRDPARAQALADRGVRVRAGDFTEPGSLTHAFEGADRVLVVSAAIRGDAALGANLAAVDAAVAAGAGRILYTSHQASAPDSLFAPQAVHFATEQQLAALAVPTTALRNGFYASTLAMHLDSALATGTIAAPADGPVSWTAHDDLAEAAAVLLASEQPGDGVTAPLTASAALDLEQVAAELSALTGRTITRTVLGDEEWRDSAIEHGLPAPAADFTLGLYRAARRGEFDVVDPALGELLGRPPLPVAATLRCLLP
ncbi:NmrA family NAD(P)-binding protein [Herbiconiux sp. VKM Ac-1786]|uniref:NmrA family NAD(P)-binding protein n=1 Tax=Herbiconiux sp. VKM Ac-1786 TaxID=2783824 RepID=UPI00188B2B2F|nr:NmrA family NAD(P)-binding protein [Herbiconiux sp. VKM Ac-1786]MBF4571559.1 NmrA family NAD(P)-binding protein [Herbiconiux sp. VKM Ac-1786]